MDLINKVLRNLEKRQTAQPSEKQKLLFNLGIPTKIKNKLLKPYLFLTLLATIILIIFLLGNIYHKQKELKFLQNPSITKITPQKNKAQSKTNSKVTIYKKNTSLQSWNANNISQKVAASNNAPTINNDNISNINELITLNNFSFDSNSDIAYLHLIINKPTYYFIENNNTEQPILLTLANTKLGMELQNELKELPQNKWLKSIKFHQVTDALVIEINLLPNVELSKLQLKSEPILELQMQFNHKINADTNINVADKSVLKLDTGMMNKIALPFTNEEKIEQEYQEAIELALSNKIPEAITKLQKILKSYPKNTKVREALASLLIKSNKFDQALKALSDGLAKDPENLIYLKFKTQILEKQGYPNQALDILNKHHPAINIEPNYYGFMASLYQKTGQYMEAAKIYNQLAKLQPYRSAWWVGLGIALESAGEYNAAIESYKNALRNSADIDPQVRIYVENKVNSAN